jgi:hypothetical protein
VNKNTLDFIIIGAQKAGTTSLFKYLELHPQIYMPREKEALYFNREERISRGWEWYLGEFFGDAPLGCVWGKASPGYMADPRVPNRIKNTLPDVKLIALLRNPIERAYSHYRMSVRKGYEDRSFEEAIDQLLKVDALEEARRQPSPTNGYIVRGEYSRILGEYYELFPRGHLCVFFMEGLENNPRNVLSTVFHFLGVDSDFIPSNLGVIFHKGGDRQRLPWATLLMKVIPIRAIWRRIIPEKQRRPLTYWFHQWNVIPDEERPQIPLPARMLLAEHYAEDVMQLSTLVGKKNPWRVWD